MHLFVEWLAVAEQQAETLPIISCIFAQAANTELWVCSSKQLPVVPGKIVAENGETEPKTF